MGTSAAYSPERGGEQSVATIHRALDLGITLIDTAEIYATSDRQRAEGRSI